MHAHNNYYINTNLLKVSETLDHDVNNDLFQGEKKTDQRWLFEAGSYVLQTSFNLAAELRMTFNFCSSDALVSPIGVLGTQ